MKYLWIGHIFCCSENSINFIISLNHWINKFVRSIFQIGIKILSLLFANISKKFCEFWKNSLSLWKVNMSSILNKLFGWLSQWIIMAHRLSVRQSRHSQPICLHFSQVFIKFRKIFKLIIIKLTCSCFIHAKKMFTKLK